MDYYFISGLCSICVKSLEVGFDVPISCVWTVWVFVFHFNHCWRCGVWHLHSQVRVKRLFWLAIGKEGVYLLSPSVSQIISEINLYNFVIHFVESIISTWILMKSPGGQNGLLIKWRYQNQSLALKPSYSRNLLNIHHVATFSDIPKP